jgi:hypothetical protein
MTEMFHFQVRGQHIVSKGQTNKIYIIFLYLEKEILLSSFISNTDESEMEESKLQYNKMV